PVGQRHHDRLKRSRSGSHTAWGISRRSGRKCPEIGARPATAQLFSEKNAVFNARKRPVEKIKSAKENELTDDMAIGCGNAFRARLRETGHSGKPLFP